MKENSLDFRGLQNYRYTITTASNVNQVISNYSCFTAGSQTWELVMNLTYQQLVEKLQTHFCASEDDTEGKSRPQQFRNYLSSLNSFLASVGKTVDSRIGVEFGSGFEDALTRYVSLLNVTDRTKRDRRSHLLFIRRSHQEALSSARKQEKAPTSLSIELRSAIAISGVAPKTLAKQAGVSPSAVQRWLNGALPNKRGIPTLRRLEQKLGLPRDRLAALVGDDIANDPSCPPSVSFREKIKERESDSYRLQESDFSPEFIAEWRQLFEYKTSTFIGLERQSRGIWRCIPEHTSPRISPLVQMGKLVSPTAALSLGHFRSFLGVILQLPIIEGGFLSELPAAPQTLAWLAYPRALMTYLNWLTARSEGVKHCGQKTFCTTVAALVRAKTGFLWQQEDFGSHLPEPFRPKDCTGWREMCEQSHKILTRYARESQSTSRDPSEPIAFLINETNSLLPILKAIEKIEQLAAAAPPGGRTEALLRRDSLLLSMLLANPLRRRSFTSMTWYANGAGTLRGSSINGWRIRLEREHLKNGGSMKSGVYDVRLADWVKPKLDAYLEEYRSTILGGKSSNYLFVSSRSTGMWEALGQHVAKLTKRFIPNCPGFGPQAFRHLVATDWLTRHPNDFLTVAELLNDKFSTVIAHYAHLKRDTSFLRYEKSISELIEKI